MNVSLCDNCIFFPNACDGCPDICTFTPKREDKSNDDNYKSWREMWYEAHMPD